MPPSLKVDDPRVMDSTGALDLPEIPGRLLVVGGYIGLGGHRVSGARLRGDVGQTLPHLLNRADPIWCTAATRSGGSKPSSSPRRLKNSTPQDGIAVTCAGLTAAPGRVRPCSSRWGQPERLGLEGQLHYPSRASSGRSAHANGQSTIFAIGDVVGEPYSRGAWH